MIFHSWVSRARGPPSEEPVIAASHLLGSSSGPAVLAAARTERKKSSPHPLGPCSLTLTVDSMGFNCAPNTAG